MADAKRVSRVDRGVVLVTGPDDDGNEQPNEPVRDEGPAPVAVQVTSPVRLDQLAAELADAADLDGPAALSTVGDPSVASADEPAQILSEDDGIDGKTLLAVTKKHRPDAAWVAGGTTVEDLRKAAEDGRELTPAEVQQALRHLLLS